MKIFKLPTANDLKTQNPIKFNNINGYVYANTYIEYLDVTYGWDTILELIKTNDYLKIYGKTDKEIYEEWVNYLENYYH